jgi:hypothetical protein
MAIARSIQLQSPQGYVHEFWKCHNGSMYLSAAGMKHLLLKGIRFALKHKSFSPDSVKIHAVCFMDNHCHKLIHYENGTRNLSLFMKLAHGYFAQKFNFFNKSTGTVNNGRPKTVPVEETNRALMRTHFYIEANPIRANSKKWNANNLKHYFHNSYRLFAFGVVDSFTEIITLPRWYMALATTPAARQRKYRKLFNNYLKLTEANFDTRSLTKKYLHTRAIGSNNWVKKIKDYIRSRNQGTISENSGRDLINRHETVDRPPPTQKQNP